MVFALIHIKGGMGLQALEILEYVILFEREVSAYMPSRNRWPGRRNGRRVNKPSRHQALELLVACPDGCAVGVLLANGFKAEMLIDLVRTGLACAQAQRMVTDGKMTEITRLRITDAGRKALAEMKS